MEDNKRQKQIKENHKFLSQKQKEEIKTAFDFFDISGSGIIDASNLKVVLRALGFDAQNEDVQRILKEISNDNLKLNLDSKIDFQKFLDMILYKMGEKETEENILRAFELFEDTSKKGVCTKNGQSEFITKDSLMKVIESLEENITEEEAEELIIRAINKNELLKTGEIKGEDRDEKKSFDNPQYYVTRHDFMKILNDNTGDSKKYKMRKLDS